jgi:hypothetical protein
LVENGVDERKKVVERLKVSWLRTAWMKGRRLLRG